MSDPVLVEWRLDRLSVGLFRLYFVGSPSTLKYFSSYPTEEEVQAALAMWKAKQR